MMTADEVDLLMADVGPLDDTIVELVRSEGATWRVRFARIDVDVELADDGRRLAFTALIGAPMPEDRARVYEGFLVYNALWRETGGTRIALESQGGAAFLNADVPVDGLLAAELVTIVVNFAERAMAWQGIVAPERADADPASDFDDNLMIRV